MSVAHATNDKIVLAQLCKNNLGGGTRLERKKAAPAARIESG